MRYKFLIDTYETEILKVASVWSMFHDEDLAARPHPTDRRGRSVREHMVHQCMSEDGWFKNMLGVDVGAPPLPTSETRMEFIRRYVDDAGWRLTALRPMNDAWWEEQVGFFKVRRSRAWIMVRRIAHTAHHRGQQMAILRMLNRELYSNYGPTADTGGLPQNQAPIIYAYADLAALLAGGPKPPLPAPSGVPVSERP
ncbi:MAG TPA: DinB family protein [Terriglobia bacterium]|nr:DinB family protein [Terriglobia bacterium]